MKWGFLCKNRMWNDIVQLITPLDWADNTARNSSPKNENLLKMYSPSGHPRWWVCFFIGTDLEKFSVRSHAHKWIFKSEWVPSEWESKHHNNPQVIQMTPVKPKMWVCNKSTIELQTVVKYKSSILLSLLKNSLAWIRREMFTDKHQKQL